MERRSDLGLRTEADWPPKAWPSGSHTSSSQNHITNRKLSEVDWRANYEAMKKATEEKDCLTDLRMSNDLPGKEEIRSDRARHGFS